MLLFPSSCRGDDTGENVPGGVGEQEAAGDLGGPANFPALLWDTGHDHRHAAFRSCTNRGVRHWPTVVNQRLSG